MNKVAYVTDVISYFHLLSAVGYCLKEQVEVLHIYTLPDLNGVYHIEDSNYVVGSLLLKIERQGINGFPYKEIRRRKHEDKKRKSTIFYIGHHTYNKSIVKGVFGGENIKYFSFEEGVGSYSNFSYYLSVCKRENIKFPVAKYIMKKILGSAIFVDCKYSVLNENSDENDVSAFRESATLLGEILMPDSPSPEYNGYEKIALFISSPFHLLKILTEEEYLNVLEEVFARLSGQGYRCLYKPHPLESDYSLAKKIGFDVWQDCAIEMGLAKLNPDICIGFNSGSLISASKVFGIPSYHLLDSMPENVNRRDLMPRNIFKVFNKYVRCFDG